MQSQFQRAIVPTEPYVDEDVREAMRDLGQPDLTALRCVYCHDPATNWDHLHNVGKSIRSEGNIRGHRLRNLVPACKECDVAKGSTDVEAFFEGSYMRAKVAAYDERSVRLDVLRRYAERCDRSLSTALVSDHPEYKALLTQILELMAKADAVAGRIRASH